MQHLEDLKMKQRTLRPSIRTALDAIELTFVCLMGSYLTVRIIMFMAGIDL